MTKHSYIPSYIIPKCDHEGIDNFFQSEAVKNVRKLNLI